MLMRWTDSRPKQLGWIGLLVIAPVVLAWALMPRLDYLPPVKRAAIDAFFSFPPGMSPAIVDREIAQTMLARLKPYMDGERNRT